MEQMHLLHCKPHGGWGKHLSQPINENDDGVWLGTHPELTNQASKERGGSRARALEMQHLLGRGGPKTVLLKK
jgi:hypothetical protein